MGTHLLTPRMAGLLDRIARAKRTPFHQQSPAEARASYLAAAEILDLPRAPLPWVEDLHLAGGQGHVCPARLYAPEPRLTAQRPALPVMLYLHGGGFVVGGIETHDSLCRQLALRSGGAVVSLDYRLAPEHPFPAAWDDAWAALLDLQTRGAALGLDTSRVAVGGDSAGGTLAAWLAVHAAQRRRLGDVDAPELSLQLLITPGVGDSGASGSRRLFSHGFLLDHETIEWFFDHTIEPSQRSDPRFAPLEASDLEGACPACCLLAECDPAVDDEVLYADRLRMAGVAVELEIYRGVTHDFMKMGRALPEASAALDHAARALRHAWGVQA